MSRARVILGLIAGVLLLLSAASHSLLGGPAILAELDKAGAPADLRFAVHAGWQFGGVAMLALGAVALAVHGWRYRGRSVPAAVPWALAAAYLGFGGWALVASGFEPFWLVFVVPGLLFAVAAPPPRADR